MTLTQLNYFRAVATLQHFTRAAEELFVAQSSLSHAITALENELGASLLERKSGKKVEVTACGRALLEHANHILADVDRAKQAVEAMRNPMGGVVKVEYSFINGFTLIPRAVRAFHNSEKSRDIVIRLEINHGLKRIEWDLRDGKLDIAFTTASSFDGLHTLPIHVQDVVAMVPADSPYAEKDSVSLEELAGATIILYNQYRHLHRWITRMFEQSGLAPNFGEIYSDWATQVTAVAMGQGVVISPVLPHDPQFVKILKIDHPMSKRCVNMHWAANRTPAPAVQTTLDFFRAYFLGRNGGEQAGIPKNQENNSLMGGEL